MAYMRKATPRQSTSTKKKPTASVTYKQLGSNMAAKVTATPRNKPTSGSNSSGMAMMKTKKPIVKATSGASKTVTNSNKTRKKMY